MENHELYRSAMDKITPSAQWEQDTLQKLAKARAEVAGPAPEKKIRFHAKRALPVLAAAAAAVVLVIPAARSLPAKSTAAADTAMEGAFDDALLEGAARAVDGAEQAAPFALFRNAGGPALEAGEEISLRDALPDHPDPCPENQPAPAAEMAGGGGSPAPVRWYRDEANGVSHEVYSIHSLDDIKTQNPTWNLPQEQLPKALPVWQAHAGFENGRLLFDRMEEAAQILGLPLLKSPAEPVPTGYPAPELWPDFAAGSLMDPELFVPELPLFEQSREVVLWHLQAAQNYIQLDYAQPMVETVPDPELERTAVRKALETFGSMLGTDTLVYSPDEFGFWYDPGLAEDAAGQKLLNYSFKRLELSAPDENGDPRWLRISQMPSSPLMGSYPLLSLKEAKAALDARLKLEPPTAPLRESDPQPVKNVSAEDVIAWEIQYFEGSFSPSILPVYHFVVKVPVKADALFVPDGQKAPLETDLVVADYYISALPDEFCVPFEPNGN